MPNEVTLWDKIIGTWAVAAGASLLYSFARTYHGRRRYLYLLCFALWAGAWGINRLRIDPLFPGWLLWLLFGAGLIAMFSDSVRRYRETAARLQRERRERLNGDE